MRSRPLPRNTAASAVRCWLVQLVVALAGSACGTSLDESLEGHSCSQKRECLPGWVCSHASICVRREQFVPSRGDAGSNRSTDNGRSIESGSIMQAEGVGTLDAAAAGDGAAMQTLETGGSCDDGLSPCGGRCVDLSTDAAHCGECGASCVEPIHGTGVCIAGACQIACEASYEACDRQCVRLNEDPSHCGACNNSCASPIGGTSVCDGACHVMCSAGLTVCGDSCVSLQVDAMNCGACGRACLPDERCGGGRCVRTCVPPTTECARSCVDLQNDPSHCGACDNECPEPPRASPYCSAGGCAIQCESGYELCDGQCVDQGIVETARLAGLGDLGVCSALAALQSRLCITSPDARYCDGTCINVESDEANCGYCGRACRGDQDCRRGRCR